MRRTCTSPRWKGFDYSSDNLYFVTSVVKNRIPCFGHIDQGKMILNEFGKIVTEQWIWLSENFPYVVLHEFVIMPDHIHGIIEINRDYLVVGGRLDARLRRDEIKIKSLSELMGAFKTTSSKKIHLAGFDSFIWQNSFHDRVIRNLSEYTAISEYIRKNPERATP